ncbi:MAG: hypothetical protein GY788_10165, partial [bacterium]|nr:hypothetical protein [bacterium]
MLAATNRRTPSRQWSRGAILATAVILSTVAASAEDSATPDAAGTASKAESVEEFPLMEGPTAGDGEPPVVRMMLKVQIPVEAGNKAIENGTMGPIFENLMKKINPEAAYFSQEDGLRTAYFVYVIDGTFEFAEIHEPLIQGLGARVFDQPALTWADIGKAFE